MRGCTIFNRCLQITFLLLFTTFIHAQTSHQYYETFETNSTAGWMHTASDANFYTQDGTLILSTNEVQDQVYLFPPIGATKDDFSIKFNSGGSGENVYGSFGRIGFKSYLGVVIDSDSVYVVYTNDVADYYTPDLTYLYGEPHAEIGSMELNVSKSGNFLNVSVLINDTQIYTGYIQNVEDNLLYGQIFLGLTGEEELIYFTLDDIDIHYNPIIEAVGSFVDEFNNEYSPWFRFGNMADVPQSISIENSSLNFNYSGTEETTLIVFSPIGAVNDFSIEVEGSGFLENGTFGLGRFSDFKTSASLWIEEGNLYLGYADGQGGDRIVIAETDVSSLNINKVKFAVEGVSPSLNLSAWINDNAVLNGTINSASEKLGYGFLGLSLELANVYDLSIGKATINYNKFVTSVEELIIELPNNFALYQNYPNPFNPTTTIKFTLPNLGDKYIHPLQTKLIVYDILGRELRTLVNEVMSPGNYEIQFDAGDFSSGIYLYKLQMGNFSETKKMMLIR